MASRRVTIFAGCVVLLAAQVALAWQTEDDKPAQIKINPFGKPKDFKGGEDARCAIYYDGEWWYIKTTSKNRGKLSAKYQWTGTVSTQDKIEGKFDQLEKAKKAANADWIVPHANGNGFDFQFWNRGGVDEVKFKAGPNAKDITFKIRVKGQKQPKVILIGKKSENPEKADFIFPAHPKKE